MPFIKEDKEPTNEYIFQKDSKTISVTAFVAIVLVFLIFGVVLSGLYFDWF